MKPVTQSFIQSFSKSSNFFKITILLPITVIFLQNSAVATQVSDAIVPEQHALDTGDTAWMLISAALVLLMTVPGIALFYAGMVRKKNVLATMMQSFSICCLISLLWVVIGYSLAFTTGDPWIGDLSKFMLNGIMDQFHHGVDQGFVLGADGPSPVVMTIPQSVYVLFQMTFIIISTAILIGSAAERIKYNAMCIFCVLWALFVYVPVAHWVWSPNGWLATLGAIDFAGGTVVHINAGIAGLVCAIVIGKRIGYQQNDLSPYNVGYAVIGASLLWVGWFGFNGGSALGANGRAGIAMLVTQIATAAGGVGWIIAEWYLRGKPTVLGVVSGAVAGLVVITPAAGFVMPGASLIMGLIGGGVCFWACSVLKPKLGYDDSLDAFGVHGIGGIVGALLTGVFAYGPLSATDSDPSGISGSFTQLLVQASAVIATIIWSATISWILLKVIDQVVGLRVDKDSEREGLDMALHNERIN